MPNDASVGERIVQLLLQEKVEAIFSQGDLSMVDIQKHAQRNGIAIVAPRHEASAVFMASGYYALTGRPQVAMGAIGPGVANLLPGAICAAQENVPVVLFGARRQSASHRAVRRGRWLYAPMFESFRSICKFAGQVDHPEQLDEIVQEAFRRALAGTPGPVYIEYDYSLHTQSWPFPPLVSPARYRAPEQRADPAAVQQAAELIRSAAAPVLLAGEDVVRTRSHDAFQRLAHLLGAPVVTTMGGTGALGRVNTKYVDRRPPARS